MSTFSIARTTLQQTLSIPRLFWSGFVDLVLPPACRFCEGPLDIFSGNAQDRDPLDQLGTYFCSECLSDLTVSEPMMGNSCDRCGMPPAGILPNPNFSDESSSCSADPNSQNLHCQACRNQSFDFDAVFSLWMYRDRVCDAIVASKYVYNAPLADALGIRLGSRLSTQLAKNPPSAVTFVPSHLFRQISRGGIGTHAIAEAVARQLDIPCRFLLKATRPIAKQAWLDDDDRKQNVHGAFSVRKGYAFGRSPKLDNQHILVVDDVLTTGATANEVARVLKDAGANRVTVAVVSRAVRTR